MRGKPEWISGWCCLLLTLAGLVQPALAAAPPRVASMNLCVDRLLLQLLPMERIAGLSYLAANPEYGGYSGTIPADRLHHNQAEELVSINPDLIIAGQFGANQAVTAMRGLGLQVEQVPLPRTLAEGRDFILQIGALVQAEAEAEAYYQRQQQKLAQARAQVAHSSPDARRLLLYSPNGLAIGEGTLEHAILRAIGLTNAVSELGLQGFPELPLEVLLTLQPERILLTGTSSHFSMAQEILNHPLLLQRLSASVLPDGLSVCPAIHFGDLATAMANTRLATESAAP